MPEKIKDKIIVALDVETASEAKRHIADLRDLVGAFKIGLQLFTAAGASFIREVVEDDIKLFLDVKFHDIPATVAKASVEVARLGVWMFNIHASGGGEMMSRTVESVREVCDKEMLKQPKITGVTVLTSSNRMMMKSIGVEKTIENQVLNLADLSNSYGLDGVIASPNEAGMIRKQIKNDRFLIVAPGIRLDQVDDDDQKRTATPAEALALGADYLVIGRPILQADDPAEAANRIARSIKLAS